ncbi:MAG: phage holin [Paenisporosarcina sp.]
MLTKVNGQLMLKETPYNVFKRLVQIWIPAFSSLYFGLSGIWDLPASEQVVGTCALIATFLGASITVSSNHYEKSGAAYDGQIVVTEAPEGSRMFSLELDGDPDDIPDKEKVTFKVADAPPQPPQIEDFSHEEDV